jgi:anaerobic magnesium-protoporphyrin IX monomethyl ester cyclase
MKVVLVNPIWTLQNHLPMNLAELAGYIRANGYKDISIIDLNFELRSGFNADFMVERAIDIVNAQKPDVIGITCNTIHVPFCVEFCREYKKRFKNPIILGGIHPTFRPNQMLQLTHADYIVRGEGEETFLELLEALKVNGKVNGIRGCSFWKGNKIIHNPDRPMIKDLYRLPFPAYDLLLRYIHQLKQGNLGAWGDLERISIVGSRGCPFGCIFCSSSKMWRYQRRKPVARVIEEIQYFTEKCRIREVAIDDDCLSLNKQWFDDLLREISKLNITWSCLTRIDHINLNLLKRMQKAGCRNIYHGIESGSLRIRNILDKKLSFAISNNSIIELAKQEIKIGISPTCSFITGIPTETKKDIEDTVNLCMELRKIGVNLQFWIMTPYVGSKAVQIYKNKLIKLDRWKVLRQSDVNESEQLFLFNKFYYKYSKENPDFYMFKPNIELNQFFELYQMARRKIGILSSKERPLSNYLTEGKRRMYFVAANKKVKVCGINQRGVFSSIYVSLKYPFLEADQVIHSLNKMHPEQILLSIKSGNAHWSTEATQTIFRFITNLTARETQLYLMRQLPLEFFNPGQRNLIKNLNMPESCKDCSELFKINKRDHIELCTGTELFKKISVTSREVIYNIFMNIALWENKPTNCIFSSRSKILHLLKINGKSYFYMKMAREYFFKNSYDDAINVLIKARKCRYEGWDFYFYLGLCYMKKGKFDKALDKLKKAAKIYPYDSETHFTIAQCHKLRNDFDGMWSEIDKGLRLKLA